MTLTVSEKPWSSYTEADYTLEQWHAACLIHQHSGPPTSKSQCKLPVKTPTGTVNRNGVIAAAGALAGARSPLQASPEEKRKAARALINYYRQMDMKPTPKMLALAHSDDVGEILSHYGVKGMKWGVRKAETSSEAKPTKSEKGKEVATKVKRAAREEAVRVALSFTIGDIMNTAQAFRAHEGEKFVKDLLVQTGKSEITRIAMQQTAKHVAHLLSRI